MKRSSRLLQLRAIAELENGQSDKAFDDVMLSLRLTGFIRNEPTLIDLLVRIAMTDIAMQPIYEGLAKHQWTDAQLVALDAELAKLDFLADYQVSMRGERAFGSGVIDYVSKKNSYERYRELIGMESDFEGRTKSFESDAKKFFQRIGFPLIPQGWFEQNKLAIAQLHEKWLLRITEPEKHLVIPQMTDDAQQAQPAASPYNFFARLLTPPLSTIAKKSARGQLTADLARTAIALERYRLARGEFPESLDALAPQFIAKLPHDIINGQPLHYRRTLDGQFVLYSVGWNETDDDGEVAFTKVGSLDVNTGDWVWRYPSK